MAKSLSSVNKSFDWVLFTLYIALVGIGLLMLYATGAEKAQNHGSFLLDFRFNRLS